MGEKINMNKVDNYFDKLVNEKIPGLSELYSGFTAGGLEHIRLNLDDDIKAKLVAQEKRARIAKASAFIGLLFSFIFILSQALHILNFTVFSGQDPDLTNTLNQICFILNLSFIPCVAGIIISIIFKKNCNMHLRANITFRNVVSIIAFIIGVAIKFLVADNVINAINNLKF